MHIRLKKRWASQTEVRPNMKADFTRPDISLDHVHIIYVNKELMT